MRKGFDNLRLILALVILVALLPLPVILSSTEARAANPQTFHFLNSTNIVIGSASNWVTIDVDDYFAGLGGNTTGVLLHVVQKSGSTYRAFAVRKLGSSDDRSAYSLYYSSHQWLGVGIDADHKFEVWVGSTADIDVYIEGYTTTGVTWLLNAVNKTTTSTGWQDINASVEAPGAIGLIFEIASPSGSINYGIRENGSTDSVLYYVLNHLWAFIGADSNQMAEVYQSSLGLNVYLVGYITSGATFNTNATLRAYTDVGNWTNYEVPDSGNVGGVIWKVSTNTNYSLRELGVADNISYQAARQPFGVIATTNGTIQARASATTTFYEIGYLYNGAAKPTMTTSAASSIGTTNATLNGNISNIGDSDVDERGFVWSTSSHVNPGNLAPVSSGYSGNWTEGGVFGAGAFSHVVEGLPEATTYYFRSVSHNTDGWVYGAELSLLTLTNAVTVGSLTLMPGLNNIAVYSLFSGDDNQSSSVVLEYKKSTDVVWSTGTPMTSDRRASISDSSGSRTNYFYLQWRAVLFGLNESTSYDVRVTYTDGNGVVGVNPAVSVVSTRNPSPSVTGTTYYVEPAPAGNDGNPGTEAQPWATIQKASNTMVAGDRTRIKFGTYSEQVTVASSGNSTSYIVFEAYDPNYRPIVDGGGVRTNNFVVTGSYILIRNMYFQGITGAESVNIDFQSSVGSIVDSCYFNGPASAPSGGNQNSNNIRFYSASKYGMVLNSTFEHPVAGAAPNEEGAIFIKATDAVMNALPTSIDDRGGYVIKGNTFSGAYNDIITAYGNFNLYGGMPRSTFIYENTLNGGNKDDVVEHDGENTNSAFYDNIVNGGGVATANLSIAASYIGPMYVVRNRMYGVKHDGYPIKLAAAQAQTGTVYLYHNSFYDAGDDGGALVDAGGGGINNNWFIKNNIFSSTSTYTVALTRAMDNLSGEVNYNLYYRSGAGNLLKWTGVQYANLAAFQAAYPTLEVNGISANPLYTNPAGGDFTLQVGSPALDVGVDLPGFNDAGSPWPKVGALPDLGYYERSTIVAPTVATNESTNVEEVTATLNGNITNTGGENNDERGFDWDTNSGAPYVDSWTEVGSFGSGIFFYSVSGLTRGELYYFRAKTHNSSGWSYGGELTLLTKPNEPSALSVTAHNSTSVSLSWAKGSGAQNTYIIYKTVGYPADRTDGTLAYNSTGASTVVMLPSSGQIYYFRSWSYVTEGGLDQWSDLVSSTSGYTNPGNPSMFLAANATSSSIEISWIQGVGGDKTKVQRRIDTYPTGSSDGIQVYLNTGIFLVDATLYSSTNYYYRAWAYDSDSGYISDSYSQGWTTTLAGAPPISSNSSITQPLLGMASSAPYVFAGIALLMVVGMVSAGVPLILALVFSSILILLALGGVQSIVGIIGSW